MKHIFISAVIVGFAFLASGCDDYEQEQRNQAHYCEMVEFGYWPNYNEDINCKKDQ